MYEIKYLLAVVKNDIPKLSLPVRNRIKKAIEKVTIQYNVGNAHKHCPDGVKTCASLLTY